MIKFCVKQWNDNMKILEKKLRETDLEKLEYGDFVKLVVENILNPNIKQHDRFDVDRITEIDDGPYQGTLLYLIPRKTYQPRECDYLMTYVSYGSCSACDTLKSIRQNVKDYEEQIDSYIELCRDIVTAMIKPYNSGWRHEEIFDVVESGTSDEV